MINKIITTAKIESEWLRHYGYIDSRKAETFSDIYFYDRMIPNGYAKVYMPLHQRCPMGYVNGLNLEENKEIIFGPRNHKNNIYTVLEYVIYNKLPGYLDMINHVKS